MEIVYYTINTEQSIFIMKTNGKNKPTKTLIIAHRGGGDGVLANRPYAIKKSLEAPQIDGVEIDLRQTKDKVLVAHHDRGVYLNGERVWIDELNYSEIKHLDIPKFEEIFDTVVAAKKILNVDIKDESVVDNLVRLLKNKKYNGNLYFDCYDLNALLNLEEKLVAGHYCLTFTPKDSRDLSRRFFARILWIFIAIFLNRVTMFLLKRRVKKVKVDGISVHYRFAGPQFVRHLKNLGLKVFVYGTDDKQTIKKLMTYGLDGIKITNTTVF